MASGWNLWVWLQCIGVVSGCCKKVYKYPHNNYYFSLLLALFLAAESLLPLFILNVFSFLFVIFVQYRKR